MRLMVLWRIGLLIFIPRILFNFLILRCLLTSNLWLFLCLGTGKVIFEGSTSRDGEKSLGNVNHSEWFLEKFSGFDDFLRTSLKGLEEPVTNFLLAVEAELQQRAVKDKLEQAVKCSRKKGIRELRGLFSSINYGSASSRCLGNGKDKALIIPQ